jgi:hypothetical protein
MKVWRTHERVVIVVDGRELHAIVPLEGVAGSAAAGVAPNDQYVRTILSAHPAPKSTM